MNNLVTIERPVSGDVTTVPYLTTLALGVMFVGMLIATVISPDFVWTENALSNLGTAAQDAGTPQTLLLFNGGLVTSGIIGVILAGSLFDKLQRRDDRFVIVLFGSSFALLTLVGLFPQGQPLHLPVAITLFVMFSVTMGVDAMLRFRAGDHRWAFIAGAGASANTLVWALWFGLRDDPFRGIAIPEIIGAFIFGAWVAAVMYQVIR